MVWPELPVSPAPGSHLLARQNLPCILVAARIEALPGCCSSGVDASLWWAGMRCPHSCLTLPSRSLPGAPPVPSSTSGGCLPGKVLGSGPCAGRHCTVARGALHRGSAGAAEPRGRGLRPRLACRDGIMLGAALHGINGDPMPCCRGLPAWVVPLVAAALVHFLVPSLSSNHSALPRPSVMTDGSIVSPSATLCALISAHAPHPPIRPLAECPGEPNH